MKKLFNYALLAAALLVGVNVNAENDCTVAVGGGDAVAANFQETMVAIATNEGGAYTGKTIDIVLTQDVSINGGGVAASYPNTWDIRHHQVINIDLGENHNIVGKFFRFRIKESTLNLTGKGILQNTDGAENSACMLYAIGVGSDALIIADESRKTVINIGENVTILNNVETAKSTYGVGIMNSTYGSFGHDGDHKNGSFGVTITIDGTVNALNPVTILGTVNKTEGTYLPVININGHIIANAKLREVFWDGGPVESNSDEAALKLNNINYYKTTHAALYAAGFGVYNIKGTLEGGIGAYIKGGIIDIKDATIKATSEEFWAPLAYGSGYVGAGSALVIDNNAGYGGNMDVKIDGNTTISSESGYGIQEVVTKGEVTTQNITIIQGEISGAEGKGAIVTTEVTENYINIEGGTFNSDITEYLGEDNIVTPTTDEKGNTIYAIQTKPDEAGDWKTTIGQNAKDYVKLATGTTQNLTAGGKAAYLVEEGTAVVTIPAGQTLEVGEIVMSAESKIIVEAGATLIINEAKGIIANQTSNLVFKAQEGESAIFLMAPGVESNKTPMATVEYLSKSYRVSASDRFNERFGIPTIEGGLISAAVNNDAPTQFYRWTGTWETIGFLNYEGGTPLDLSKMNEPFRFYQMLCNTPTGGNTLTMKGRVVGNSDPILKVSLEGDNGFANSFLGKVSANALVTAIVSSATDVDPTIYHYGLSGANTHVWDSYNLTVAEVTGKDVKLAPMQAFYLNNAGAPANVTLDYSSLVWEPAVNMQKAPANNSKLTSAYICVTSANGMSDKLLVVQDEKFNADYERGYDAEKRMNEEMNIFAKASVIQSIVATDNLTNMFVGFNCKEAGQYSISFTNVNGEALVLVDTKTNARVEMVEGNTYEFLAEAGEDAYRFQIVAGAQAPTEMNKTNAAVKATRALINGQIVINNGERFFNILGAEVK